MPGRLIAIGDIHGCSTALAAVVSVIDPQPEDTIIGLGDYVDRGIDSKGVLDFLINLSNKCRVVPILGNHDEMMLRAREGDIEFQSWMNCGGNAALDSYRCTGTLDQIPLEHFQFLEQCVSYFETNEQFFVHANYHPHLSLNQMDHHTLRWLSLRDSVPSPHDSVRRAFLGHTPQVEVLDLGYLCCLDTGCCNGGWLTAMDVISGQQWQADKNGRLRNHA